MSDLVLPIFIVGLLPVVIGVLWLIVQAFRRRIWWGLFVLLVAPLVIFPFVNGRKSLRPLILILGGGLIIGCAIAIDNRNPAGLIGAGLTFLFMIFAWFRAKPVKSVEGVPLIPKPKTDELVANTQARFTLASNNQIEKPPRKRRYKILRAIGVLTTIVLICVVVLVFANQTRRRPLAVQPTSAGQTSDQFDKSLVFSNRGWSYYSQGDLATALSNLNEAIKLYEKNSRTYLRRCIVYHRLKQFNPALLDCTKAIELEPDFDGAYSTRSYVYKDMKQYTEALSDLSKAIQLHPNASDYYIRADTYDLVGDYKRAYADYKKALELDTSDSNLVKDSCARVNELYSTIGGVPCTRFPSEVVPMFEDKPTCTCKSEFARNPDGLGGWKTEYVYACRDNQTGVEVSGPC